MACLHLERETLDCAIYVDTGYAYTETLALVEYVAGILPMHVVKSQRREQNEYEGIPSDVVPIDWTRLGQSITAVKPVKIQSYLGCCAENISFPLFAKAKELGVTHLVCGQREDESHRGPVRNGHDVDGIVRLHPIEKWTEHEVLAYLATKMEVPAHYAIKHSSLDCYDCTAYRAESHDRIAWMREKHPVMYEVYRSRYVALSTALLQALGD